MVWDLAEQNSANFDHGELLHFHALSQSSELWMSCDSNTLYKVIPVSLHQDAGALNALCLNMSLFENLDKLYIIPKV